MSCFKRIPRAILSFSVFSFLWLNIGNAGALIDATGMPIVVGHPKRVVTLAPSLGELAFEILGKENASRIVGVTEYTKTPSGISPTNVGSYAKPNIEKIVSLKPTLVVATMDGNPKNTINRLRELNMRVLVVRTETLEQVMESMRWLGLALGQGKKGEQIAQDLKAGIAKIEERVKRKAANLPKRKVMFQVGEQPLVVAGKNTFINDIGRVLFLENVYETEKTNYPRPSVEDVLKKNPDVILVLSTTSDLKEFRRAQERWQKFNTLSAVKNGKVKFLAADLVLKPTLRLVEGFEEVEKAVYE